MEFVPLITTHAFITFGMKDTSNKILHSTKVVYRKKCKFTTSYIGLSKQSVKSIRLPENYFPLALAVYIKTNEHYQQT